MHVGNADRERRHLFILLANCKCSSTALKHATLLACMRGNTRTQGQSQQQALRHAPMLPRCMQACRSLRSKCNIAQLGSDARHNYWLYPLTQLFQAIVTRLLKSHVRSSCRLSLSHSRSLCARSHLSRHHSSVAMRSTTMLSWASLRLSPVALLAPCT